MPTVTIEIDDLRQLVTEAVSVAITDALRKNISDAVSAALYPKTIQPAPPGSFLKRKADALERYEQKKTKKIQKAA